MLEDIDQQMTQLVGAASLKEDTGAKTRNSPDLHKFCQQMRARLSRYFHVVMCFLCLQAAAHTLIQWRSVQHHLTEPYGTRYLSSGSISDCFDDTYLTVTGASTYSISVPAEEESEAQGRSGTGFHRTVDVRMPVSSAHFGGVTTLCVM